MKKILSFIISVIVILVLLVVFLAATSLSSVNDEVKALYKELKIEVKSEGYKANFFPISGKRPKFFNRFLPLAMEESEHFNGNALDIFVLDINEDQRINNEDVKIVYDILDQKIVKDKGAVGQYIDSASFLGKQMVHFDNRGEKVRW